MGKSQPKAPKPPDPKQVAAAQTGTNIGTAIAQQGLNAINQVGPYGSLTYATTGYETYTDPYTGQSYQIPTRTATTALSPEQQKLYEQQTGIQSGLNTTAQSLLNSASPTLGSTVDLSRGALDNYISDNYLDDFNKQWDTNQGSLATTLANKGIKMGSAAYDKAIADFNTSRGNAYGNYQGSLYDNARSTLLAERNQPLQELAALLGQGAPTNPQFQSTPQTGIEGTDVAGAIQNQYNAQLGQYNAQLGQQNAMMGGLSNLGSAAISGWAMSDERLKEDIEPVGAIDMQGGEQLPVYTYNYKPGTGLGGGLMQLGVLAQEAERVAPDAVATTPSGYKAVNYSRILERAK